MYLKKPLIACLVLLSISFRGFSQADKKIDSIKDLIRHIPVNDKIKKASQLIALGQQYINKAGYPAAMDCFEQSLAIAQSIGNDSLLASSYKHLSVVASSHQDYYKDSVYDYTALKIYRKIHDKLNEGLVLKNIAGSYLNRGKLTQAKQNYDEALAIFKQINQQRMVAGIYSDLAVLYKYSFHKSIELELAAKKIWDKYPTNSALPLINIGNLGVAYFYMVRFDSLKRMKPDSIIPASAAKSLAIAEKYTRQAIQMAQQRNDIEDRAYYSEILSELQYHNHNYKGAYDNFYYYENVNDSIFSQDNKNKIAELESRNEIQKKNQEILSQKFHVQAQQRNILLLLSGLLIVVIIGAFFYRLSIVRNQKKQRAYQA